MAFLSVLLLLLSLSSRVPHVGGSALLEPRQVVQRIPLIGIKENGIVLRREIRDFSSVNGGETMNLFLLALDRMYNTDSRYDTSYWQVAILATSRSNGRSGGYSIHSSEDWIIWHRAYVALLEQKLYENAKVIVNTASNSGMRASFARALTQLRFPYWDWLGNDAQLPSDLTQPNIMVTRGDASKVQIPNPLYQYKFPAGTYNTFAGPFNKWAVTKRCPHGFSQGNPNQLNVVNSNLACGFNFGRNNLSHIFRNSMDFKAFAFTLDRVQGDVHVAFCSDGHMSNVDYAPYDLVNFLVQANLDRVFAMWQAIYPNTWLTSGRNSTLFDILDRMWEQNGIDVALDIIPFWQTGRNWNTDDLRHHQNLGYSYPEFVDSPPPAVVKVRAQQLYDYRFTGPRLPAC